ncbi:STAS domain-containing protein [Amycolatopsis sp. lyj-112]|uniref:STAS domain-containing protein n=1 Tax=Amycolatopsis sp. lyj-112 TaxID=2789288 RepID=UPI0039784F91
MKLRTLDLRRRPSPAATPLAIPAARGHSGGRSRIGVDRAVTAPPIRRNPPLTVATEHCGRTLVLIVDGDVDLHTAPAVHQALESALSRRPRRLVVDLSRVQFLNSAGLEVLLDAHQQAAPHTDLRLVATTRATWRPLQITRLHEQLAIHASRDEAVAAPARRSVEGRSPPVEPHRPIPSFESTPS